MMMKSTSRDWSSSSSSYLHNYSSSVSLSDQDHQQTEDEEERVPLHSHHLHQQDFSTTDTTDSTSEEERLVVSSRYHRRWKWPCFVFAYILQALIFGCKLAGHFSETTLARKANEHDTNDGKQEVIVSMGSILMWFSLLDISAFGVTAYILYLPLEQVRRLLRRPQQQQRSWMVPPSPPQNHNDNHQDNTSRVMVQVIRRQISHYVFQGYISIILVTSWILLEQQLRRQQRRQQPLTQFHLFCIPWALHLIWFCCRTTTTKNNNVGQEELWLTWFRVIVISLVYTFLGSEIAYRNLLQHDFVGDGVFEGAIEEEFGITDYYDDDRLYHNDDDESY